MQIVLSANRSQVSSSHSERLSRLVRVAKWLAGLQYQFESEGAAEDTQKANSIPIPNEGNSSSPSGSQVLMQFTKAVNELAQDSSLLFQPELAVANLLRQNQQQAAQELAAVPQVTAEEWELLFDLFTSQLVLHHRILFLLPSSAGGGKQQPSSPSNVIRGGSVGDRFRRFQFIHSLVHLLLFMATKNKYNPFAAGAGGNTSVVADNNNNSNNSPSPSAAVRNNTSSSFWEKLRSIESQLRQQVDSFHDLLTFASKPGAFGVGFSQRDSTQLVKQIRLVVGKYWLYISESTLSNRSAVMSFFAGGGGETHEEGRKFRSVMGTSTDMIRFGAAALSRAAMQIRFLGMKSGSSANNNKQQQLEQDGEDIATLLLKVLCRVIIKVAPELNISAAARLGGAEVKATMIATQRTWVAGNVNQLVASIRSFIEDLYLAEAGNKISTFYARSRGWLSKDLGLIEEGRQLHRQQLLLKKLQDKLNLITTRVISEDQAQKSGLNAHMSALLAEEGPRENLRDIPGIEETLTPYHIIVMSRLGLERSKVAGSLATYANPNLWSTSGLEEMREVEKASVYLEHFPVVDPSSTEIFNPPGLVHGSQEGQLLLVHLLSHVLLDEAVVDFLPKQLDGQSITTIYTSLFVHDLQSLHLTHLIEKHSRLLGSIPVNHVIAAQKLKALVFAEGGHILAARQARGGSGSGSTNENLDRDEAHLDVTHRTAYIKEKQENSLQLRLRFAARLGEGWSALKEREISSGGNRSQQNTPMLMYFANTFRALLAAEELAATLTTNPELCMTSMEILSQLAQVFPATTMVDWGGLSSKQQSQLRSKMISQIKVGAIQAMSHISKHRDLLSRVLDQAFEIAAPIPHPGSSNLGAVFSDLQRGVGFISSEEAGNKLYPYLCGMSAPAIFREVAEVDPLPPVGGLVSSSSSSAEGQSGSATNPSTTTTLRNLLVERWVPIALAGIQAKGIASEAGHDALQIPIRESSPWLKHVMPTYLLATAPDPALESGSNNPQGNGGVFFRNARYGVPQRSVVQRFAMTIRLVCEAAEAFHPPTTTSSSKSSEATAESSSLSSATVVSSSIENEGGAGLAMLATEHIYNNVRFWNGRIFRVVEVTGSDRVKRIQERGRWYMAALVNMLQCSDPRVVDQVCTSIEIVLAEVFDGMQGTMKYWKKYIGMTIQRSKTSATKASLANWLLTLDERLAERKLQARRGRSKL